MVGQVDGKPFRTEVTLLPDTRIIEWQGQRVETLVSQYTAYLDGRIHEVAYDFYAQADDGSVWYFGEDVFRLRGRRIADQGGHLDRRQGRPCRDDHARRPEGRRRVPDREHPRLRVRGGHRQVHRQDARRTRWVPSTEGSSSRSSTWTGPPRTRPSPPATASSTRPAEATSRPSPSRCPPTRLPGLLPASSKPSLAALSTSSTRPSPETGTRPRPLSRRCPRPGRPTGRAKCRS